MNNYIGSYVKYIGEQSRLTGKVGEVVDTEEDGWLVLFDDGDSAKCLDGDLIEAPKPPYVWG
ncbi:hypothetical protein [Lacticaseibacillus nasuensis]|uniref:hypothetical protein n=1 Tax=Lacticaseibacillus nasuensis TaxID=944671 RepID=UPI0006D1B8A4|nr:hypothetical protein [Lacticaseibacillus nasuensis]MCX2455648.1 hypothetical protein [Lacticaseibacillus nasuensis]